MSDIYLSLTETPAVVTLSQPVVSGVLASNVTVTNVVSVNVVTMPAITVQSTAPAVTTVAGTVTISNFPSTQNIAGTVTVGNATTASAVFVKICGEMTGAGSNESREIQTDGGGFLCVRLADPSAPDAKAVIYDGAAGNAYVNVRQTSSVTIGSLPAISGTVTVGASSVTFNANIGTRPDGSRHPISLESGSNYVNARVYPSSNDNFNTIITSVTQGSFGATINGYTTDTGGQLFPNCVPVKLFHGTDARLGSVTVGNSVTIGAMPNGTLTTRFGTPTTANTAFATSCVTNSSRKYLLIQNVTTGSNVITVGIGFTPTTTQGIQLTAGAGITFESSYIPTGAVQILSSVTASNFTILEA